VQPRQPAHDSLHRQIEVPSTSLLEGNDTASDSLPERQMFTTRLSSETTSVEFTNSFGGFANYKNFRSKWNPRSAHIRRIAAFHNTDPTIKYMHDQTACFSGIDSNDVQTEPTDNGLALSDISFAISLFLRTSLSNSPHSVDFHSTSRICAKLHRRHADLPCC
jgi:hypothetical protein